MIDSHTHLNLEPLLQNHPFYIDQAQQLGITHMVIPGVNLESSQKGIEIANRFTHVYAAVGYHPEEAETLLTTTSSESILNNLAKLSHSDKVVALGETGLDYFRLDQDPLVRKHQITAQKKLFKLHIKIGLEFDLPIIVHVRDAHQDALEILQKYKPKAVLHCFSGDESYLKAALDLGCYISFAGNLTFANAKLLRESLKLVPQSRLLLETDAPFLNPQRGQWPNTPANVVQVYELAANIFGISVDQLGQQVVANSQRLFNIE